MHRNHFGFGLSLTEHKSLDIYFSLIDYFSLGFNFEFRGVGDHAPELAFRASFLCIYFEVSIYDNRHFEEREKEN